MISKSILGTIVKDQGRELELLRDYVPRSVFNIAISYAGASAFVIKGVRRCGKSTLLKQIINKKFKDGFMYFNFDDERISGFETEDFQTLMETLIEIYGERKNIFFDEIQNIKGWELFINRILRQGYKVFITGSNANLLSKELGTHLTGRHVDIELYPFSFTEFLNAYKIKMPKRNFYSTEEKALFLRKFKEYFEKGGMPEAVVFSNESILTQLINDIIQKDIINRYNIRKLLELKTIIRFLISNCGNLITYRSIAENFKLKSSNTVQKYVEYTEETYLLFTVRKFERKLKRLDKNPKKLYCIDTGIIIKNTPNIFEKKGAILENIIAIHLKRLGKEFYYYNEGKGESDFIIPSEKLAIQVCYELNKENKDREIKGILEAAKEMKAGKLLILTLDQSDEISQEGKKIIVKPAWQWLLENDLE